MKLQDSPSGIVASAHPEAEGKCAEILRRASEEIAGGNFSIAARLLTEASEKHPDSVELLVFAGLALLRCDDVAGAAEYLERALALNPNDKDVWHNLALANWTQGRREEACAALKRITEIDPEDADAHNDLGVFREECGEIAEAERAFQTAMSLKNASQKHFRNYFEFSVRSQSRANLRAAIDKYRARWGDDATTAEWYKRLNSTEDEPRRFAKVVEGSSPRKVQGLKIAFLASYQTFLAPIMDDLRKDNELRLFEKGSEREMEALLKWCDLAWFEWCDNLLVTATQMPKSCRIICRLHSYEVFTELPRQVDWSKVDHLVLVNRSVQQLLACNTEVSTPMTIIHNGVDTSRFTIPKQKKYGKRICSVGYINYKKNPGLLLYCFKAIHDYDNNYRFHIAGTHQDPRFQVYFEHLLPRLNIPVTFDGWVEDMPRYFEDKDYVISTSLFESFHYSIAEGMASGVIPLIHDWMGADYIYPQEFIFTTPSACVELLKAIETKDRRDLGERCREFILSRYDLAQQLAKINELIITVMGFRGERRVDVTAR